MSRPPLRRRVRLASAGVLAATLVAASGATSPRDPEAVEAEVRRTLDEYVATINAGEWAEVPSFYADDPRFRWIEDGAVRYTSRDEIVATFEGIGDVFSEVDLRLSDVRIYLLGPGAVEINAAFQQDTVLAGGQPFSFGGAISITLVLIDDEWRFLTGHTSSRRADGDR